MYTKGEKIVPVALEDEMRTSYIDYSMSVIVGRALPDARDGLKPVHRRILFAMQELSLEHNKPYKKCARIVGETLGKFHPHGDMAVYDALVRMVQDFSLCYPLIDGQGNFGCFTKETKVRLADGRSLNFGELIAEDKKGKTNYTFSYNHATQKVEIAKIRKPRLTKTREKLVKILLDNNKAIRCTLDHPFMLRNGAYKKAKDLQSGDSLMPLYTEIYGGENDRNLKGYEIILQPMKNEWEFSHHLSDAWNMKNAIYKRNAGKIRHHRDFNKLNNNPENIQRIRWQDQRNDGVPNIQKALSYFSDFQEMLNEAGNRKNHKVKSVTFLKEREDVYDLTVDGTHNFALACGVFVHNSVDGDPAAAMRYTEARMDRVAEEILDDIDKQTVDFRPNFDESLKEPTILPGKMPNLLINGSSGIAVGMATNIPPHNLGEVVNATKALIDDPHLKSDKLMKYVKGPDFPTGGVIYGLDEVKSMYLTGKGRIKVRARAGIEPGRSGKECIVITEIPYMVNKSNLITNIAKLVQTKRVDGITDIRDESDKEGLRVIVELRRGVNAKIILNKLFKHTQMEDTFGAIMLALDHGRPVVMDLRSMLQCYIDHRKEVVYRRTKYELEKAEARAHILEGFKIALANIDKIVAIIKKSKSREEAKLKLMSTFKLSEIQANAILDMRLYRLTGLEQNKIKQEYLELIKKIAALKAILASEQKILGIIKDELTELVEKYGDNRRTEIVARAEDVTVEDLIAKEGCLITISHRGYIKRVPVTTYKPQRRGGKGVSGMEVKDEDYVEHLFTASTHDYILFFTEQGQVHWLKVYEIPQGGRLAKGRPIINLLNLASDAKIAAMVRVEDFNKKLNLLMASAQGYVKKTELKEFSNPRSGGIIGIKIEKSDRLIGVELTSGTDEVILFSKNGKSIRFKESDCRPMGRATRGVRGMKLGAKDEVVSLTRIEDRATLLVVTEQGYGKRSKFDDYRLQSRGGKGIIGIKVTNRNGPVVETCKILEDDEIVLISSNGKMIRLSVNGISVIGRATQGVRVITMAKDEKLEAVTVIMPEEE